MPWLHIDSWTCDSAIVCENPLKVVTYLEIGSKAGTTRREVIPLMMES